MSQIRKEVFDLYCANCKKLIGKHVFDTCSTHLVIARAHYTLDHPPSDWNSVDVYLNWKAYYSGYWDGKQIHDGYDGTSHLTPASFYSRQETSIELSEVNPCSKCRNGIFCREHVAKIKEWSY